MTYHCEKAKKHLIILNNCVVRRYDVEEGVTMADCKWCKDEICVNADCPMCTDYCPVPDTEGVCRFEDRGADNG